MVELALGKTGMRLRAFAETVDLEHPHLAELFSDELRQSVGELLQLANYGFKNNLTRMLPTLGEKIKIRETLHRALKDRIRLLRTREARDLQRSEKRVQAIDLNAIARKGEEIWDSQPSNFDNFVRFNTSYQEEISFAERKATVYKGIGCTYLAKQAKDSIDSFKTQVHEVYYGFNRITMTNAAVILAKSLGFKLVNDEKTYRIEKEGSPYEPKVYPLNKLWQNVSPSVERIVDHLESFPEACGKAIFDAYAVVVPEAIPGKSVLLGDKDNKCFFILEYDHVEK